MPKVIGVRFRRAGKVYHFDPGEIKIEPGANVIVETARGLEMGEVVYGEKELPDLCRGLFSVNYAPIP